MVPGGQSGTVKVVEVAGAPIPCARAGDTVDVHFNGVDTQVLMQASSFGTPARVAWQCTSTTACRSTCLAKALLKWLHAVQLASGSVSDRLGG